MFRGPTFLYINVRGGGFLGYLLWTFNILDICRVQVRFCFYCHNKCKLWPPWTDILLRFTRPSDAFITECWSTESKLTHWNMEYMYITLVKTLAEFVFFFRKSPNAARRHINQLLTWSSVMSLRHGVKEEGVKICYWSNNPFLSLVTRNDPPPPFFSQQTFYYL